MKKLIVICLAVCMMMVGISVANATGTYADLTGRDNYKASTGLTLGAWTTVYEGVAGYGIADEFQINLLYQPGILDSSIDAINDYWVPMNSTYNFPDHEEYVLNVNTSGGLTIYEYAGLQETIGGPEIQWTLTAWHQTILTGDIIESGGTTTLRVLPTGTYRPFVNDPPVNDVEVFDGNLDTEVLAYTFNGSATSIGDGSSLGVTLVPEPISSTLFIAGGAVLGYRYYRKLKNKDK